MKKFLIVNLPEDPRLDETITKFLGLPKALIRIDTPSLTYQYLLVLIQINCADVIVMTTQVAHDPTIRRGLDTALPVLGLNTQRYEARLLTDGWQLLTLDHPQRVLRPPSTITPEQNRILFGVICLAFQLGISDAGTLDRALRDFRDGGCKDHLWLINAFGGVWYPRDLAWSLRQVGYDTSMETPRLESDFYARLPTRVRRVKQALWGGMRHHDVRAIQRALDWLQKFRPDLYNNL